MSIADGILYFSLFMALFFEVFLLITYFEIREEIKFESLHAGKDVTNFPTTTIIVPCFNEERTLKATLESLLALNYPKDKFSLMVVDDGSTDGTQKVLNEYRNNPQVTVYKKENGGKHTALNFALEHVTSELVGCLDADSFVDSEALRKMVPLFNDPTTMAVTPSVKVYEPETALQHMQRVEYSWGVLLRRILSSMNALYVTPGPFSIFRTKVFRDLGGYRSAHHTEDMEIALRMHKNGYKITNSHGANVYTVAPPKLKGLYKQRVRWAYGFLNNAFDYRDMYFNKKYGHIGVFILPMATFSIFSTLFAAGHVVWGLLTRIPDAVTKYQAVGFTGTGLHVPQFFYDWFYLNTGIISFIGIFTITLSLTLIVLSLKLANNGKLHLNKDLIFYFTVYPLIVPFWLAKATYSTFRRQTITWR